MCQKGLFDLERENFDRKLYFGTKIKTLFIPIVDVSWRACTSSINMQIVVISP